MDTILITHKPCRVVRCERYDDPAEGLARYHQLLLEGASQLVMYEATQLTKGKGNGNQT